MIYDCPNCRTPQEAGRTSCPRCQAEFDGPVPEDAVLPPAEDTGEPVLAEPLPVEPTPVKPTPYEPPPAEVPLPPPH